MKLDDPPPFVEAVLFDGDELGPEQTFDQGFVFVSGQPPFEEIPVELSLGLVG